MSTVKHAEQHDRRRNINCMLKRAFESTRDVYHTVTNCPGVPCYNLPQMSAFERMTLTNYWDGLWRS